MTEIVDGIAWTPETRARVYPSRKRKNPAFLASILEGLDLT